MAKLEEEIKKKQVDMMTILIKYARDRHLIEDMTKSESDAADKETSPSAKSIHLTANLSLEVMVQAYRLANGVYQELENIYGLQLDLLKIIGDFRASLPDDMQAGLDGRLERFRKGIRTKLVNESDKDFLEWLHGFFNERLGA